MTTVKRRSPQPVDMAVGSASDYLLGPGKRVWRAEPGKPRIEGVMTGEMELDECCWIEVDQDDGERDWWPGWATFLVRA